MKVDERMAISIKATWSANAIDGDAEEWDASAKEKRLEEKCAAVAVKIDKELSCVPVEGREYSAAGRYGGVWTKAAWILGEKPDSMKQQKQQPPQMPSKRMKYSSNRTDTKNALVLQWLGCRVRVQISAFWKA